MFILVVSEEITGYSSNSIGYLKVIGWSAHNVYAWQASSSVWGDNRLFLKLTD